MKIGFTGTQGGMTKAQMHLLDRWLRDYRGGEFHHGDCVGADAEAHDLAYENSLDIWIHPPINGSKRAGKNAPHILEPKDYLARNHDIVDATDALIATPKESEEVLRSGTWSTVRYAKKKMRPVNIIFPDGQYLMWRPGQ